MNIVENIRLNDTLGKTIGVDVDNGCIIAVNDEGIMDITNDILELVVLAIESSQTFILWNRSVTITVEEN